jgi:lipopolysaccharide export system permease protein
MEQRMNSAWRSTGSYYMLREAFGPMRNTFLYVILILECVRLKQAWTFAAHMPNPTWAIIKYLGLWLPLYSSLALQVSLAVGMMMGLAKISRSRELDALYALGFSLHQLLMPVIALTLGVALSIFVIVGWLHPLSLYASDAFVHDIKQSSVLVSDGTDMFRVDGTKTILLDGISRDGKEFDRVFIYETYPDGKAVTTAGSKGRLTGEGKLADQHYFVDGLDVMEVKSSAEGQTAKSFTVTRSTNVQGPLNMAGDLDFRLRGASEYEWTLVELLTGGKTFPSPPPLHSINAEINYRFAQLFFIMLIPFIAVVVIIEPRRNPGPFRFLVGLMIVLAFNQYLSMGTSFSRSNILPPVITLWVPLAVLTIVVAMRFWKIAYRPAFHTAR